ncbi:LysR family transcriptional regulator [Streptomyces sp. NPDC005953]|uniref:LysR family transcriptional regulator n=1 Tax=Streptomyces sp. NPDC005953 TaxID=3156719 RepID=UPI0033CA1577
MELRHLEYFAAVAQELSFTRASQRLHVAQSGVSTAIRSLERELGAALFERTSQKVTLTTAGLALLPEARATLDAAQAARDAVRDSYGSLSGTVTVGVIIGIGRVGIDLPRLLGRLNAQHPQVTVRLRLDPTGSAGLTRSLLAGELDAAFLSFPGRVPAGVAAREVLADPLRLLVPTGHPLAQRNEVSLGELAEQPFIDFPPGYGNRELADQAFLASAVQRRVTLEVPDFTTAAAFVREGLGVAFVPRFAIPDDPGLRTLTVADAPLRWSLSVATSATRRPTAAVRALLDLIDARVVDTDQSPT